MKGAPPPPETVAEVRAPLLSKLKRGHLLATDGAQAYGSIMREGPVDTTVPHVTVVHKKKNFVSTIRYPKKFLCSELQEWAAELPSTSSTTVRVKAGSNGAEAAFSAIKRNVSRMNMQRATANAGINMLSAGWLQKHVGFDGVAEAVGIYISQHRGHTDPALAYWDVSWLKRAELVN